MSRFIRIFIFSLTFNCIIIVNATPPALLTNDPSMIPPRAEKVEPDLDKQNEVITKGSSQPFFEENNKEPVENPCSSQNGVNKKFDIILDAAEEFPVFDVNKTKNGNIGTLPENPDTLKGIEETQGVRNRTLNFKEQILSKIESALLRSRENKTIQTNPGMPIPNMMPIFRPNHNHLVRDRNLGNLAKIGNNFNSQSQTQTLATTTKSITPESIPKSGKFVVTGAVLKPLINGGPQQFSGNVRPLSASKNSKFESFNLAPPPPPLHPPVLTDRKLFNPSPLPRSAANNGPVTLDLGALAQIPNQSITKHVAVAMPKEASQNSEKNNATVVFYKPDTISLEEFYGDFLKRLTMTVLVPFYASQLVV